METSVADRPEQRRYEITVEDGTVAGFAAYRRREGEITFSHTEVETAYEGRGLGSVLVRRALDAARADGLAVLPACPFVRDWIARHEDYLDLVRAGDRDRYDLSAA